MQLISAKLRSTDEGDLVEAGRNYQRAVLIALQFGPRIFVEDV